MGKIIFQPIALFSLAYMLLIIPIPLLFAWLFAAVVHEAFHVLALKIYGVPIYSVEIGVTGAKIYTGNLNNKQEFFCALAGPVGGLLLLIFSKTFPLLSVCGFIQSFFNLLPILPFDGGRILQCVLIKLCGERGAGRILRITEKIVFMCFLFIATQLVVCYKFYMLAMMLVGIFYSKKFLAKKDNTQYNR